MPYATTQNLIDRFEETEMIQITNPDDPTAVAVNAAKSDQALLDAEATINRYLVSRYPLPLASVPAGIPRIACDIARYYLYEDRATDRVEKLYNDAIKFLEAVGKGTLNLGLDSANNPAPVTGGPQVSAPQRVMTAKTLEGL